MIRSLLALLVAILLCASAPAATSTTVFSAVSDGPAVKLRRNEFVQAGSFTITGTGTAKLAWQYSTDQTNWSMLATYSAAAGPIVFANPGFYRFSCTAFTSGTLTAVITTPAYVYQQQFGTSGAVVFQVDDTGVTSNLFSGPTSGGSSTFAGLTITGTAANSVTNAGGYTSTHATGVAPFTATSTTVCPNLNASLLNGATFAAPGTIGGTTSAAATFTTVTGNTSVTSVSIASTGTGAASVTTSGGYTSTVASGTAPITVTSTDVCPNLHAANSDALGGATFAAPGAIGGTTPAAITGTTVTGSTLVSTVAIGTAPLTVTSTTNVPNLNASSLSGSTFASPGAIGSGSASTGAFTTLTASTATPSTSTGTGTIQNSGGYAASRASFFRGLAASSDANAVLVNYFSNQSVDPAAYRTSVAVTNNNGGATAGNSGVTATFTGSIGNSVAGVTDADVRVFEANVDTTNATATNTLATGFYFKNGTNTGTTTTKVGFQCEALTGGTVYAFRSAGAGLVKIGDATAASASTTASVTTAGGYGAVKPSYFGTIGSTFSGNVQAGVQDGTADTAGAVGEVVQGTNQTTYVNFTTTNTLQQLAVLTSLPPGRYRLAATVTYSGNAATNAAIADAQFAISTTTASIAGAVEGRSIAYITEPITSSTHLTVSFSTDVNISAATSQFLNGKAIFAAGSPQYVASLTAYRLR